MGALFESNLPSLKLLHRGKVRDIFDIDDGHMLIITTDRLSAFDAVLPTPIPGKGRILTAMSYFWFARMRPIVPNQLTERTLESVLPDATERAQVEGRAMVVRKLKPLRIEAIVRGYLAGTGWQEYQKSGTVCGIGLPAGLQQAQQLPEPIFTPSTKAAVGKHDENISFEQAAKVIGEDLAQQVRRLSLTIYKEAAAYARERGIIIADTKFEFGLDEARNIFLIDEALTADSSRFWPVSEYRVGMSPPSFDKQYVRDYLTSTGWDKKPPAPALPPEIVAKTAEKYREALFRLTGQQLPG